MSKHCAPATAGSIRIVTPNRERPMTALRRRIGNLAAAFAFLPGGNAFAQSPAGSAPVALPNTPAGAVIAEWLEAFNAADSLKLGAYYKKYALDRSITAQLNRARQSGGFEVVSIEKSRPRFMELVLRERAT